MSDSTTLLVGAHGFVGRHLCEAATSAGLDVLTADRAGSRGFRCDLLDSGSVEECVSDTRPARIVNMAGAASVAASWEDPAGAFAINATGVLHLLEAVARHAPKAHVLCVSSAEVYGEPSEERLPFTEDQAPAPVTPYGESKAEMEAFCRRFAHDHGLKVAVVRAFNQIGPGQSPAFAASGFARQIAAAEAAAAERVELAVGNLAAARDFTDVRDTARAFLDISQRELTGSQRELTGTYNLCSGKATKLEELVAAMAEATPLPVEIVPDPSLARPADPSMVYGDPARLREATGWEPRIPLAQTVADLLDWWRAELDGAPSISST